MNTTQTKVRSTEEALKLALEAWENGNGIKLGEILKEALNREAMDSSPNGEAQPEQDCTRSHPHENMSKECELRTEIARLTNELARLEAQPKESEQEPVAWRGYNWGHSPDDWVYRDFDDPILDGNGNNVGQPLYTTPPQRKEPEQRNVSEQQEPVACIGYWNQKTGAYYKPDQISAAHQKLIEDGILRRCYTTPPQLKEPEQEPVPDLYVKDINGNFHSYKEKGHTVSSQCVPPSHVGVGEDDFTPQRTWVELTHSDIDQGLLRSDYAFKTAEAWRAGVVFAMTKLKEKNT